MTTDFKAGDRVRVVNYGEPAEGQIGTVIADGNFFVDVKLPIIEASDGSYWWVFKPDELEHVDD